MAKHGTQFPLTYSTGEQILITGRDGISTVNRCLAFSMQEIETEVFYMQQGRREKPFSGLFIIGGRIKSDRLMSICFTGWLLAIAVGCSINNSAKTAHIQNGNADVPRFTSEAPAQNPPVKNINLNTMVYKNETSKPLDCDDPDGYSLVVITDPERASQNLGTVPQILNVVSGDKIRVAIKVPTDSNAQNFSLSSTERTKEGFNITIEYGSRYYYKKQLYFICKEGDFYLHRVMVESFDKNDPKSMSNWSRKVVKIKPNLPIEKFSIFDYLSN
jgi:hypothetical protein